MPWSTGFSIESALNPGRLTSTSQSSVRNVRCEPSASSRSADAAAAAANRMVAGRAPRITQRNSRHWKHSYAAGRLTRVLITGGAGFVGANLAVALAERHSDWGLTAFDNLHRPGSELNLPRLEEAGVAFVRGDVRERAELDGVGPIDALVECSAEPSALVGMTGDTSYPFETNLVGAYNCLELARRDGAQFVFLSTSRVYPYPALGELGLERTETRFELAPRQPFPGVSPAGISEDFPLDG